MLLALAAGVHIALALAAVGFIGTIFLIGFTKAAVLSTTLTFFSVASPVLVVVPLFVFMGVLAGAGGISRDLYTGLSMWVGRVRGALGIATVASCTAFGVVTGSSVVTSAVFSRISAPEMRRQGFDKRLAYGICAASGSIGMLIPPSILIVLYSILSEVSTGALLIAGIAPGLLLAIVFSAAILVVGYLKPSLVGGGGAAPVKVTWRQRFASLRLLWPIIVVGFIIIGGIFTGVFSSNEAASWGAVVLMIITIATAGSKRWQIISRAVLDSVSISAMIFFILAGAAIFARLLMLSGMSPRVLGFVTSIGLSKLAFVVVMSLIYLAMGCFLDSISMLSITLPIIIPAVNAMGINPIYFAMVVILSIEAGLLTPPVGLNVYAAKSVADADVSLEDVFRGSIPFFLMMLVALAILIAFPRVSTILPDLMFAK
ncbi:TRAP transporter large permease [Chloroflexota bacterium]